MQTEGVAGGIRSVEVLRKPSSDAVLGEKVFAAEVGEGDIDGVEQGHEHEYGKGGQPGQEIAGGVGARGQVDPRRAQACGRQGRTQGRRPPQRHPRRQKKQSDQQDRPKDAVAGARDHVKDSAPCAGGRFPRRPAAWRAAM